MKQLTMEQKMEEVQQYNAKMNRYLNNSNNNVNALFSDPGLVGALHPALRPNNVHDALKERFQIPEKARDLFRDMMEPLDEYRDILDKAFTDNIGFLSGGAGFPDIETAYESVSGVIKPYGGKFKMTFSEMKWSRIGLTEDKMRQLIYGMQKFYEKLVLTQIRDNNQNSFTVGTAWSNLTTGDPFSDIEKAVGLVEDTSGFTPDMLVLNRNVYNTVITKRKEWREFQLRGVSDIEMVQGFKDIATPNGLKMRVFDATLNSFIADDKVYVLKRGQAGVNHVAVPFTSFDGPDPNSPLNRLFFAHEWTAASTDKRDGTAICEIDITP